MEFSIMIIYARAEAMTSQLKSFPTRELAERIAEYVLSQGNKMTGTTSVIKLYV